MAASRLSRLPFSLNRLERCPLVGQIADGLRTAIADGFFVRGDVLPSRECMARELGTGECTVRSALERLIAEGVIMSRPRIGCTVVGKPERRLKGDILLVATEQSGAYSWFVFQNALQSTFVRSGYRVSTVFHAPGGDSGRDSETLCAALAEKPDFVIVYSSVPQLRRTAELVAKSGFPYATVSMVRPKKGRCVGTWYPDFHTAIGEFVSCCARLRIHSVCQVDFGTDSIMNAFAALEEKGVNVERLSVRLGDVFGDLDAIQRSAARMMRRRIDSGPLPDLLFFTDDFLARGALPVLLERGIRIPQDVRVVTHANRGFTPAFPTELSRIEIDFSAFGREFAENVVACLRNGTFSPKARVRARFLSGQTFAAT